MGSRSFSSSRTASSSGEVTDAMRGPLGFGSFDNRLSLQRLRDDCLRLYDPCALIATPLTLKSLPESLWIWESVAELPSSVHRARVWVKVAPWRWPRRGSRS